MTPANKTKLYCELAEALGLPDGVVSLSINMDINSNVTLTIKRQISQIEADKLTEVMSRYRIELEDEQ